MLCCGGAEEDFGIPPANQYNTSLDKGNAYGGGGNTLTTPFILFMIVFPFIVLSSKKNYSFMEKKTFHNLEYKNVIVLETCLRCLLILIYCQL